MNAIPKIRNQFKANIYAQASAFILNVSLYAITQNLIFIWVELACLSFIGMYNAKSPEFFDRNIFNHFISVMCYYFISLLIGDNSALYLILIFIFTYAFFILRSNGYHRSLNLWMYIQALLIGTTFTSYPFHYKIIATIIGYLEAQFLLNFAFKISGNKVQHEAELRYHHVIKIPVTTWLDSRRPEVKLALRGSFTAAILYAICSVFHDIKPNWAVVTAISCLQRDDYLASIRAIKGIGIGTLVGWPIAIALIKILGIHTDISTGLIWLFLIIGLSCGLELSIKPRLPLQIASSLFILLAVTCVSISLQLDEISYLNLKTVNSIIGICVAFVAILSWQKLHKIFDEVN